MRAFFEVVQEFEEFSCILFAVSITIWLIKELQSLDEDFQAFFYNSALHHLIAEKLFKNLN
jgi:hypothetical protein